MFSKDVYREPAIRAIALPLWISWCASTALFLVWGTGILRVLVPALLAVTACAVLHRARQRSRRVLRDVDLLSRELDQAQLPDLTSLHPTTPAGRDMAEKLQGLLDRVQHAVREEEAARAEIERAQALRVGFVASMGHDLRGPLSSMLGFAELLLADREPDALAQLDSVRTIHQRTLDLLTLIDEMLDWARLEAGRMTLNLVELDVSTLLRTTAELVERRSAGRGLQLDITVAAGLPVVEVDSRYLPHAIVAVLGDAIRSASKIPVSIAATADARGGVLLRIHDPSLLIRDEDRSRFFEPFRPSYAPSGKRIAGLGLGAACARALITAHGGELSFESTSRLGTIFSMWLPRPPSAQR